MQAYRSTFNCDMVLGPEITGLISIGIFVAGRLIRLADTARRNREKCCVLKRQVEMISLLLQELQRQWTPDPVTGKLLQDLNDALDDGRSLVESCQEKRTWSLVFRTQKKAKMIDAVGQRISKIMESFHIANMILIIKNNRNGAAAAYNKAHTSSSALPASAAGDVQVVARLAASALQETKTMRQNSEEIQQLVQFVELVANLMEQLQSASLWWAWDAKTKPLLDELKDLLLQARNILSHQRQPHRSSTSRMAAQAFSCVGGGGYHMQPQDQETDQILQVAYKIGYYIQVIPLSITMRQTNTDWASFV